MTDNEGAIATATQSVTVTDEAPGTLEITGVTGSSLGGRAFRISWTTTVPADSLVTFTHQNGVPLDPPASFSDATLVTSHAMDFNGSKNVTYTYTVTSKDAGGNSVTSGPHTYRN